MTREENYTPWQAHNERHAARCNACLAVPGKDGLGRPCKRCKGTGTTGVVETGRVEVRDAQGNLLATFYDRDAARIALNAVNSMVIVVAKALDGKE
jgi:hypothetical protein